MQKGKNCWASESAVETVGSLGSSSRTGDPRRMENAERYHRKGDKGFMGEKKRSPISQFLK